MAQDYIFSSPSNYVQGKHELFHSFSFVKPLGDRIILLIPKDLLEAVGRTYVDYLESHQLSVKVIETNNNNQFSLTRIQYEIELGQADQVDLVIGLGNGHIMNLARRVADQLPAKLMLVPTIATSHLLYFKSAQKFYRRAADLILVDTQLIANSPKTGLASGIGNALAASVEAQAVSRDVNRVQPAWLSLTIADRCEQILFNYGLPAVIAAEHNLDTVALDNVIEAAVLMSGISFSNGSLSVAHAICDGIWILGYKIHRTYGEVVSFGILAQLILEGATKKQYDRFLRFELKLNFPTTFKALGLLKVSDGTLKRIAKATVASRAIQNVPGRVTVDEIIQALESADAYDRYYCRKHRNRN